MTYPLSQDISLIAVVGAGVIGERSYDDLVEARDRRLVALLAMLGLGRGDAGR